MKVVVAAFYQEKALVEAFSVIVQLHRLINLRHDSCDTTSIPCSYQQTHLRQLAVEWHQPSTEAGVQYQLQQRHEILPTEPGTWTDIYSDKNNYFILTGLSRGSINNKLSEVMYVLW